MNIGIQINASEITNYEKIIAVSLSEFEMETEYFWSQTNQHRYDPICDIVIRLNAIIIIIETKRDSVDCTSQLYNQAYNIVLNIGQVLDEIVDIGTPKNWTVDLVRKKD